ncbi:MAG: transcriptional repressor [Paludibacteraceae bacterium]|nr:transcriptional repressor [Paludibacteraceae bacterium]
MTVKECCEIMEHAGVKPTSIRILIYKAVAEMHDTFSLGDLDDLLDDVDKSSIFRALRVLNDHHLIHALEDGSGSVKYCVCHNHGECKEEEHHCHFFCEKCKKTYCLEECVVPRANLPLGFEAHEVNYVIKGICSNCKGKGGKGE